MKLKSLLAVALVSASATLNAALVEVSGSITTDRTWTADNTYRLSGYVFVTDGATLTIDPGTVVVGEVSSGSGAAALVITRDSKIMAVGTAENPIIFTSELDDLQGTLSESRKALWGGVVILGNAQINSRSDNEVVAKPIQDQIEGFSVSEDQIPLITFGGTDDLDNSGTMRYVSIRHGGAVIGTANEINGLTLGGVGSGTSISHIEVYANKDDGFEFFGGAVNATHLVSAFVGDDSFDFDQGFRGNLQFLFTIQDGGSDIANDDPGDKAIEWDGATTPKTETPISEVTVANLTAIGRGDDGSSNSPINPRDNATVKLYNSIFTEYAGSIEIESDIGDVMPDIKGNIFWSHITDNNTAASFGTSGSDGDLDATAYFTEASNNNSIEDPGLLGISRTKGSFALDPRLASDSAALTGAETISGTGLTQVDYKGAFNTYDLWIDGWTKLSETGYLSLAIIPPPGSSADDHEAIINRGSPSKPLNISTRGFVGTGDQVLNGGFVIGGNETQSVLIRAMGPSLGDLGVAGVLADPVINVFEAGATESFFTQDDFTTQATTISAEVGAFAAAADSADSGVVLTLAPGGYTVVVSGKDGATGIVLIEVYEVD